MRDDISTESTVRGCTGCGACAAGHNGCPVEAISIGADGKVGVLHHLVTDLAVSLTGIAGPGGGSAEKPVGLVWFGLSSAAGTVTEKKIFPGGRGDVRAAASEHALTLLLGA